jgi:hypothetical protein
MLRSESANAAVRRKHPVNRAVGEHDDLVHQLGESSKLGNRRGKRRMPRIDLLGDEDDLGHV